MNNLWLCDTLGTFWRGVNWENQVRAEGVSTSDRYITVKQFFQSIPWVTMPVAAEYDQDTSFTSSVANTASDTLADFLQDVSNFF